MERRIFLSTRIQISNLKPPPILLLNFCGSLQPVHKSGLLRRISNAFVRTFATCLRARSLPDISNCHVKVTGDDAVTVVVRVSSFPDILLRHAAV